MSTEFYLIAVVLTTILSASRLARLAVIDKFPPVKKLRERYEERTDGSDWQWLTMCAFCFAPWTTLFVLSTGLMAEVYSQETERSYDNLPFTLWWIFNGWLAMSYLAASYVARDGAVDEDD